MINLRNTIAGLSAILLMACNTAKEEPFSLHKGLEGITNIQGKSDNGNYLYVTAGDKLYSIGNQAGEFPEIGFHVPGEMGGVWQHPIKLLDGYKINISDLTSNFTQEFDHCDKYICFPFANQFYYNMSEQGYSVVRTDFVPDQLAALAVEYEITNEANTERKMEIIFDVDTDLSPVWLGEKANMIDTKDILIKSDFNNTFLAKDSLNNWFAGITSDADSLQFISESDNDLKGKGINLKIKTRSVLLGANEKYTVRFYISGSSKDTKEVNDNLTEIRNNIETLFNNKKQRYAEIDNTAAITIPDTLLMKAYQWSKYNTDWLIRDVSGMGRGINAGLPDYPWFFSNDQAAAFSALYGTIDPQIFYDSWDMMRRISNKTNNNSGQIVHEASTNGVVYDKGRMEESQEFIIAALEIFHWTGDKEFLKTYYEQGKRVWDFLKQHDKNNNLFIEGYGGTEIEGLNDEMLDVAVWTQAFFKAMAEMATLFDEKDVAADFTDKANTLKEKINENWWIESENRYADFLSNKEKAIQLIDMVLEKRVFDDRNLWAKKKLTELKQQIKSGQYKDKGYVVFYNPSTLLPLHEDIATEERAKAVLSGMEYFTNKYGLYITGIARPDDITMEESSVAHRLKGEFNYNEAIMTIATSGLAISETKYNGADSGMKYIKQILNNFSYATPGTTYEVNPDYGMFVQAWNVQGINIPLIRYMFGVHPYAYTKNISIKPDMPTDWNFAKLDNLLVGNTKLSIDFKRENNKQVYKITILEDAWTIDFFLPRNGKSIKVNGKEASIEDGKVVLSGKENTVEVSE
ncbi:hypothetical protein [Prevotella sp. 10(H)]|uniref:alpha-L-rhamnosidase-related protein n=1 Tax=Prevotella sp. 10(H) TaxID=1158294 RepID=UPI000690E0CB|nr:hypothetical protein [Prevotella sp. 10(H)]